MNISAIIPAYNEEYNIETVVHRLHKALLSAAENFEIIVVNDGSTDATEAVIRNLLKKYDSLKTVCHTHNKGYGCALRSGYAVAAHEWIFIMDSDNQFDPEELNIITGNVEQEIDALVGYRKNRKDSLARIVSSRVYNILIRYLFGLRVRDINCAFKLFKRSAITLLDTRSCYYVINTEILLKLKSKKCIVKEFPVTHYPRKQGRSKIIFKDTVRTCSELLLLKREKM